MKLLIKPLVGVNGVRFGDDRNIVRNIFGNKFEEIKKNVFSKNTFDAYDGFHIYFSKDNKFEAIEVYGEITVYINDVIVYPGKVKKMKDMFPDMVFKDESFTDFDNSISILITPDDSDKIESIMIGCVDYFQ